MLLFVKSPWCDQLARGEKTWELRADIPRYRGVREGSVVCVNGRQYYRVVTVRVFATYRACVTTLGPSPCGDTSIEEGCASWRDLYPTDPPVRAWRLVPCPRPIKS